MEKIFGDINDPMVKRRLIRYLIIGGVIFIIILIIIIAASSGGSSGDSDSTEVVSGSCPKIKYVSGGMSGSGFASRYWDCCKPSCSWTENAGSGNEAKQCDANMNVITDHSSRNICEGESSV